MFMNGVGIPSATSTAATITAAAVGALTATTARLIVGTATSAPTTGSATLVSGLPALQASKYELWLCSTSVAQAASRSGTGT